MQGKLQAQIYSLVNYIKVFQKIKKRGGNISRGQYYPHTKIRNVTREENDRSVSVMNLDLTFLTQF